MFQAFALLQTNSDSPSLPPYSTSASLQWPWSGQVFHWQQALAWSRILLLYPRSSAPCRSFSGDLCDLFCGRGVWHAAGRVSVGALSAVCRHPHSLKKVVCVCVWLCVACAHACYLVVLRLALLRIASPFHTGGRGGGSHDFTKQSSGKRKAFKITINQWSQILSQNGKAILAVCSRHMPCIPQATASEQLQEAKQALFGSHVGGVRRHTWIKEHTQPPPPSAACPADASLHQPGFEDCCAAVFSAFNNAPTCMVHTMKGAPTNMDRGVS